MTICNNLSLQAILSPLDLYNTLGSSRPTTCNTTAFHYCCTLWDCSHTAQGTAIPPANGDSVHTHGALPSSGTSASRAFLSLASGSIFVTAGSRHSAHFAAPSMPGCRPSGIRSLEILNCIGRSGSCARPGRSYQFDQAAVLRDSVLRTLRPKRPTQFHPASTATALF